ncbi:MAG: ABC transporter ATP-binding protein [Candidatus Freyarchaeota archaeon]
MFAIEIFGLCKNYNRTVAVSDLSMTVPVNTCFGFLGPNGAGKTTTMKMLIGLAAPTRGSATVLGYDIIRDIDEIRERIGYLPEFAPKPNERALSFLVRLARVNSPYDWQTLKRQAKDALEEVGLWEERNMKVHKFSMGMFKKWLIAQALMGNPELLFLDEPTANLDPMGRVNMLDLIMRLKKERTVFLNSHVLPEVERVVDHVGIIGNGKLIVESTWKRLRSRMRRYKASYLIVSSNNERMMKSLEERKVVDSVQLVDDGIQVSARNREKLWHALTEIYADTGIIVTEYREIGRGLEDIFLSIMQEERS